MASEAATELAVKVITATMSVTGAAKGGPSGALVQTVASQIDVAAELASKGTKITPAQLKMALARKVFGVANIAPSEEVQCIGSLASLGLGFASVAASLPTGPLGWMATGLSALADLYGAYASCGTPAKRAAQTFRQKAEGLAADFYYGFWSWVNANGGAIPAM